MDTRYATALRHATQAWSQHRTTDPLTLQELQRRNANGLEHTQVVHPTEASAATTATLQPELARFGALGTRLNVFA